MQWGCKNVVKPERFTCQLRQKPATAQVIVMNTDPVSLDRTDIAILAQLQRDGRITNAELAERVNLSASACLRRTQRLEHDGVIGGYGAWLDPTRVGLGLQAFVRVQLAQHDAAAITRFGQAVQSWDEVEIGRAACRERVCQYV